MKNAFIGLFATLIITSQSNATISVNFDSVAGGVASTGGTSLGDLYGGSSLLQLIWSSVNAYSSDNAVGGSVDAGYFILWSGTFSGGVVGGDADGGAVYSNADVGGSNINAGYIYGRVFTSTSPILGEYFGQSALVSTASPFPDASSNPTPPPGQLDLISGPSIVYDGPNDLFMLPMNIEIVPEPSVLAFVGLGGLALAARRRFVA